MFIVTNGQTNGIVYHRYTNFVLRIPSHVDKRCKSSISASLIPCAVDLTRLSDRDIEFDKAT